DCERGPDGGTAAGRRPDVLRHHRRLCLLAHPLVQVLVQGIILIVRQQLDDRHDNLLLLSAHGRMSRMMVLARQRANPLSTRSKPLGSAHPFATSNQVLSELLAARA
ncbi:MAG TPA: hypothetical protein VKE41_20360, partial [Roseiflexaceae bacterium]|nr:hypothetical protein [Roseiflexaceae bacterium]